MNVLIANEKEVSQVGGIMPKDSLENMATEEEKKDGSSAQEGTITRPAPEDLKNATAVESKAVAPKESNEEEKKDGSNEEEKKVGLSMQEGTVRRSAPEESKNATSVEPKDDIGNVEGAVARPAPE